MVSEVLMRAAFAVAAGFLKSLGAAMADFWADLDNDLKRGVRGRQGFLPDAFWMDPKDWQTAKDSRDQLMWPYDKSKVLLGYGRDAAGRPIGIGTGDDRGILTCTGTRGGKGRSLIVPNLLLGDWNAIVLDPKGELAAITARARAAKGQRVFIIDPFGVSGAHKRDDLKPFLASYNPLLAIDVKSQTCIDDAALIADAIIQIPAKGETHWAESAQSFLTGLILLACGIGQANFGTLRNLMSGTDPDVRKWGENNQVPRETALFAMMRSMPHLAHGQVARAGGQMLDIDTRERGSILSTMRTQCRFMDGPELKRVTTTSSFQLSDLKTGITGPDGQRQGVTVYLCLPASVMATYGRWLRLMINLTLVAFERTPMPVPKPLPTLFILEELCTTIGYSRQLESAAGLMAGFGIRLWSIIQDLSQLKHQYSDSWETWIGNAGTLTFFGNSDMTTLDYISKKLGNTSMLVETPSGATPAARLAAAPSVSEQMREAPLLPPVEAEQKLARENRRILIVPAGRAPFILRRAEYDTEQPFKGLYDKHEA
jgi:type IV secretion system protein VirD4